VVGLIGASIEVTDRVRAAAAIASSEARLRRVLDQLFAFVGVASPEGVLEWANRAPLQLAGLTEADVVGKPFWQTHWWSYAPEAQARVKDAMTRAAHGEVVRFDIPVLFTDAEPKTIDFQVAPLYDDAGRVRNLIPSGILIEDRVQAERARELLIGELHHRIKNLYTIATGMVQRSARAAPDKDALVRSVSGRLMAMAEAHDLIRPSGTGHPAPIALQELLLRILPQHADHPRRIRLDGPPVAIRGDGVTPMALILHELATNAAKYGALGSSDGTVTVSWETHVGRLVIRWVEQGGPPNQGPPAEEGFGSKLIRTSAEQQLQGSISRSWADSGCTVVIDLPDSWIFTTGGG
jgi:PAS domain S-box-containing protein